MHLPGVFFPSAAVKPVVNVIAERCRCRCCCWCCRRLPAAAAALNFCLWNGFESRRVGFVAAPCRTVPPRPCPRQSTLHLLRVQGTFLEAALLVIRMFDKSQSCTEAKTTHLSHLSLCSLNVYISPDRYSHPCLCLCIPVSKYPVSSSQSCCKCYWANAKN